MSVPAAMIALETTPDKHIRNLAVYGSTRAQATDVVDKVCVSGLEVHFSENHTPGSAEAFLSID